MAKRTCGGRWHWSALLSTFLGDLREEQGLYDPLSFLLGEWVCSDQLLGRTGLLPCGKSQVVQKGPILLTGVSAFDFFASQSIVYRFQPIGLGC